MNDSCEYIIISIHCNNPIAILYWSYHCIEVLKPLKPFHSKYNHVICWFHRLWFLLLNNSPIVSLQSWLVKTRNTEINRKNYYYYHYYYTVSWSDHVARCQLELKYEHELEHTHIQNTFLCLIAQLNTHSMTLLIIYKAMNLLSNRLSKWFDDEMDSNVFYALFL